MTAQWEKSSHSNMNGSCVEWRKSSDSSYNGNCVEVAECHVRDSAGCHVRDSKDRDGPVLSFSPQAWRRFIDAIKHGEFGC
jgi:hypothetical protein